MKPAEIEARIAELEGKIAAARVEGYPEDSPVVADLKARIAELKALIDTSSWKCEIRER